MGILETHTLLNSLLGMGTHTSFRVHIDLPVYYTCISAVPDYNAHIATRLFHDIYLRIKIPFVTASISKGCLALLGDSRPNTVLGLTGS
jgi:hypothetical protein